MSAIYLTEIDTSMLRLRIELKCTPSYVTSPFRWHNIYHWIMTLKKSL